VNDRANWDIDQRLSRRPAVAAETRLAFPDNRADLAVGDGHFADAKIARIADDQVAILVHRDVVRLVQLSGSRRPAVAAESRHPIAGDRADSPSRGGDLANAVVADVGDVNITVLIDCYVLRIVELRPSRRAAVTRKAPTTDSGDCADNPSGG